MNMTPVPLLPIDAQLAEWDDKPRRKKIIVEQRQGHGCMAFFEEWDSTKAMGRTEAEAIGNLIIITCCNKAAHQCVIDAHFEIENR